MVAFYNGAFFMDNRYQTTALLTTAGGWRGPDIDEEIFSPLEVISTVLNTLIQKVAYFMNRATRTNSMRRLTNVCL